MTLTHTCDECGRTFDMWNAEDAIEWANGHDCEAPAEPRDSVADVLTRHGVKHHHTPTGLRVDNGAA